MDNRTPRHYPGPRNYGQPSHLRLVHSAPPRRRSRKTDRMLAFMVVLLGSAVFVTALGLIAEYAGGR